MKVAACAVIAVVCSAAVAADSVQRTLTFEERVNAQAAIERIYYSHQIGTTKSFDEAVPRSVLESKVRTYLDESAALPTYWKTAVADETLQRELERMTNGTRMPERLTELFDALGNDPFLIKECLARPALVDRLTHNFYALDPKMHIKEHTFAEDLRRRLVDHTLDTTLDHPNRAVSELVIESEAGSPANERRSQEIVSREEFQRRRAQLPETVGQASDVNETRDDFGISVVLSESTTRLRVATYSVKKTTWDAWWATAHLSLQGDAVAPVATGQAELLASFKNRSVVRRTPCDTGGWDNGALDDTPDGRGRHTTVWTGSEMLVWGGQSNSNPFGANTGNRYDPATDSWSSMSTTGAPRGRMFHTAIWTGNVMVIWGGEASGGPPSYNTGGRYDPLTDSWSPVTTSGAPSGRTDHTAVWTGSVMVVWGGNDGTDTPNGYLATGGRYDPVNDTWTPTSTTGAPSGRFLHTGIWTGHLMVVWGGLDWYRRFDGPALGSGGRYDPIADRWTETSGVPIDGRYGHSAVWTGRYMVIWGGTRIVPHGHALGGPDSFPEPVNTGARYNPATDRWSKTSTTDAPFPRSGHGAVWTGSLMLVWGPYPGAGGRYDVSTDSWTPTSAVGAPQSRESYAAVWTGSLMVVWGGVARTPGSFFTNTGARYDPSSDSWTPTSLGHPTGGPPLWTGSFMLITGGRYDPALDAWTFNNSEGAPQSRSDSTTVWSGSVMIVWGGRDSNYYYLNTGARYDPLTDSWTPTSMVGAPSPRSLHSAVWTGSSMVVWGGLSFADANSNGQLDTGGRYDPLTDSWSSTSAMGAPPARFGHTAIWTGNAMVVWGGEFYPDPYGSPVLLNTGARYDPQDDSWASTAISGAPSGRFGHSSVWVGSRMVVWGGETQYPDPPAGGRYDPASDTWLPVSTTGEPVVRRKHAAVSTGRLMMIWGGGFAYDGPATTGGYYDPEFDRWTKIPTTGQPADPMFVGGVWTGSAMMVWNGARGGRYVLGASLDVDCDGDGFTRSNGDCDDRESSVYPGAPQLCDGLENDCHYFLWPYSSASGANSEDDYDEDGFLVCQGDCDDFKSWVHPGMPQLCDGLNNDCSDPAPIETDLDRDGVRTCAGDCDDTRSSVRPGARERCDGLDNDCDGIVDNHPESLCLPPDDCNHETCEGAEGCVRTYTTNSCDDLNPCTTGDVCNNGWCSGTAAIGASCDDQNGCTADDRCDTYAYCRGTRLLGTPCNDYNQCTHDDACDGYGGCRGLPLLDGTSCDDGGLCSISDACEDGNCRPVVIRNCDDGSVCTGSEYCESESGQCVTEYPLHCDDGNDCTVDSCDPVRGCVYTVRTGPCDDGDACTLGDTCVAGECLWGPVADCDDGNPCTDDSCGYQTGCVHAANTNACNDGNACTQTDGCSQGECVGSNPVICGAVDQCRVAGICNPATGLCGNVNKPDGTVCDDHDLCTKGETCWSGACTPAFSGLTDPKPQANGYYKGLCTGSTSWDELTDADAVCVASVARTFAGISTVADICAQLKPNHPTIDPCDPGENELMVLALNICRGWVCTAQSIDSRCDGKASVGQSLVESDTILSSPSRNGTTCEHAKCLAEEINSGRALEMN